MPLVREAAKFLEKIPSKVVWQVAKKIHGLLDDPLPEDSIQIQNSPFLRLDSYAFGRRPCIIRKRFAA